MVKPAARADRCLRSPASTASYTCEHMSNTYLAVPFKEKDSAKALGARWDRDAGQWYVP